MTRSTLIYLTTLLFISAVFIKTSDCAKKNKPYECRPLFARIKDSTMCRGDSAKLVNWGVSDQDKKLILDTHNNYRANVEPPATNMIKLVWDDAMAEVAEKLAKGCKMAHDKNRNIASYPNQGQNLASTTAKEGMKWDEVVKLWYDEIQYFEFGTGSTTGVWQDVGHFTQVVNNAVMRIGCGMAECQNIKVYACNYARGQLNFEIKKPYTDGERCSACSKYCKNGLCDCAGLMCKNGGKLELDSCSCQCKSGFEGSDCGIKVNVPCPESDPPENKCKNKKKCKNAAWKTKCPKMCGQCDKCGDKKCENDGYLDPQTCKCDCGAYATGAMCETKLPPCGGKVCLNGGKLLKAGCRCLCPAYYNGDTCDNKITTTTPSPPEDLKACTAPHFPKQPWSVCKDKGEWHSKGRDYEGCGSSVNGCDKCTNSDFSNKFCPFMCGVCDYPCGGKQCHYGGKIDPETCKCQCPPSHQGRRFTVTLGGELCEKIECPANQEDRDKSMCCPRYDCGNNSSSLPMGWYRKFVCPYRCGLCLK